MEIEELVLYGGAEKRLRAAELSFSSAHSPRNVPPEQA
jgi:hypothetical protein